jgi:hypothetical protein
MPAGVNRPFAGGVLVGVRDSLRPLVLPAVAVFGVVRVIGLLALAAAPGPPRFADRLTAWDGGRYLDIARMGYPRSLPEHGNWDSNIAFFPLYPFLVRVGDRLSPGPPLVAAIAISLLGGAVAAALIAVSCHRALGERCGTADEARAIALATAALWSVHPASFVLAMAYSEGLFTALAAGCLLALLTRHWWTAGVLALLAGATRPSGVVLAVCCAVAAVHHLRLPGTSPAQRWRTFAALGLAPLGTVAYLGWLSIHYHRVDAWFAAQRRGWEVYTDGGRYVLERSAHYLQDPATRPVGPVIAAGIVLATTALVLLLRSRPPPVLGWYAVTIVVLTLTTHGAYGSIPRYLLPAFPLLLPLARPAVRIPRPIAAGLLLLAAAATGLAGAWTVAQHTLPP